MERKTWRRYGVGGFLLLLAAIIYGRGVDYPLLLDDAFHIDQSPLVRSLGNWWEILKADYWERPTGSGNWRPLLKLAFAVQYSLWGHNPVGYRIVLIGFLWLAAMLTYKLGRMFGLMRVAALAAAAIVVAHPAMVEVAHNGVALSDLAGIVCSLVAIILVLPAGASVSRNFAALLVLVVGLGFKESVIFAFPVVCIAAWYGPPDATRRRNTVLIALGCGVVGAIYLGLRLSVLQRLGTPDELKVWPGPALATKPTLALWLVGRYAALTFWPGALHADYRWLLHQGTWMQQKQYLLLGCAAILALFQLVWRGRRDVRHIAAAIIICGLLPYLQFVYVQSFFAERHLSFVLVGVGLLVGYVADIFFASTRRRPPVARITAFVISWGIIALATRSSVRLADWRNAMVLWETSSRRAPTSVVARTNYSIALLGAGDKARAHSNAVAATRIEPDFADAWRVLGDTERSRGNWQGADIAYRKALSLAPADAEAMIGLSKVMLAFKNTSEAERLADDAVRIQPGLGEVNGEYLGALKRMVLEAAR